MFVCGLSLGGDRVPLGPVVLLRKSLVIAARVHACYGRVLIVLAMLLRWTAAVLVLFAALALAFVAPATALPSLLRVDTGNVNTFFTSDGIDVYVECNNLTGSLQDGAPFSGSTWCPSQSTPNLLRPQDTYLCPIYRYHAIRLFQSYPTILFHCWIQSIYLCASANTLNCQLWPFV